MLSRKEHVFLSSRELQSVWRPYARQAVHLPTPVEWWPLWAGTHTRGTQTHMSFISFFLFFFLRQGLFSSGYPRTLGVHQAGLKFRDPPACLTSARTEGIHLHAQQSSFFLTISETRKETFWKWGSHSNTHSLFDLCPSSQAPVLTYKIGL